ncbi:hypothetical protein DL546_006545 [Coniochaeta pulveracea]|uniref:FAR1 domain-containing protein n=1 Tax=Coniochaeta pulveracea TaxID=177199 RepID=A0A420YI39_9PEZI|nr:hypothetical protein DL546_006545 [Coniochaeta pulveracea]
MQMLPPPEDRLYSNFEELHADLKKWTLAQGYALSIDSSSNRDATGIYRRYNLSCIRGGKVYKATSTGQRNTVSKKTGCLMKVKATKQDGWPWNGRWRITVMCADHNHPPFNPDIPNDVPPAFRHIEGEGLRWLLIMHREAKLNLRQLTIGLRTTFGDKYRFVKKSDVSNTLSKVKREEEKELAKRPPGAPPVPPGAMTAFMAALLNPVPDPYQNGVPYELIGYMPPQSYPQQYVQPQQGQVAPQPYLQPHQQQQFVPQPHVPHQQQQFVPMTQPIQPPPQQMFIPQQYVPPQPGAQTKAQRNKNQAQPMPQGQNTPLQQPTEMPQPTGVPQATQAQHPTGPNPVQQQAQPSPTQWKNYTPGPNNAPPQQQPQTQQQQYNSPYQSPQVPQQPQPQPQQQQQQPYQQIPQQQQPPSQQPPQITGQRTSGHPGPGDRVQLAAGQPSLYQPTTLQATPVPGVPGAVVMEKAFSDVSDDESEVEQGEEDGEGEQGEEDGEGEQREEDGEGDSD